MIVEAKNVPEVRDTINSEDLPSTKAETHRYDSSKPEGYSEVGPRKLPVLMGFEHDSIGVEVYDDSQIKITLSNNL